MTASATLENYTTLTDATRFAVNRHPHEWSADAKAFSPRPAHMKGAKPVGPNGVVGPTGGDPNKEGNPGVLALVSEPSTLRPPEG
jgi:hypothetical protein